MGSLRQYAGSPFGAISRTEAAAIARRGGIAARPAAASGATSGEPISGWRRRL
jgi:hypothetical protein